MSVSQLLQIGYDSNIYPCLGQSHQSDLLRGLCSQQMPMQVPFHSPGGLGGRRHYHSIEFPRDRPQEIELFILACPIKTHISELTPFFGLQIQSLEPRCGEETLLVTQCGKIFVPCDSLVETLCCHFWAVNLVVNGQVLYVSFDVLILGLAFVYLIVVGGQRAELRLDDVIALIISKRVNYDPPSDL